MLSVRDALQIQEHTETGSENGQRYFMQMESKKKGKMVILISHKIDFKIKTIITRDKERHYVMIKGSIQEEDITIVNTCIPNIRAPQYT